MQNISAQLEQINLRLSTLSHQMQVLADRQRERDELLEEMKPILKEVMKGGTERLADLEERGYFTFAREGLRALDRVVQAYSEDDVRALGDNIVRIMDTVRNLTQPEVLEILNDASDVVQQSEQLEPTGVFGMMRASRDDDVRQGMAVLLGVLRQVGRGVKRLSDAENNERRPKPTRASAPARPAAEVRAAPKSAERAPVPPVVAPRTMQIDGVAFDSNGFLADPNQWTPELATAIASAEGLTELSERHWQAINWARNDFLSQGQSPNIRRITMGSGVPTKELYALFPRAPGMTVARVAGIPKPVGCI
ncbi:MAG: TusE/DsrC/DsvC family sulfur relay protein [Polyangiaceae bacterium]|nr:TusE/DsrC/DsvC family sulfur relay protein [Myxococcales bacterium]MCB9590676.1 TusE/DsrC/DsvC family sulfur relay protein [Polyangiaceae bacterium]